MKGYWTWSFYVCLCVGLLFSLVSCGGDNDGTPNTDLLVAFTTDTAGGPGSVQRYDGRTGAPLGAFVAGRNLSEPTHAVFGPDGNLYVTNIAAGQVLRYNGTTGAFLNIFVDHIPSCPAMQCEPFSVGPVALAFGPDGNLYVSNDFIAHQTDNLIGTVERYNGTTGASLGTFASAGLDVPTGIVFGPDGNLYVSSFNTNTVERFNGRTGATMGTFAVTAGGELNGPEQLVFGPDGMLYVTSFNNNSVVRFNGDKGGFRGTFVKAGSGGLNGPTGLAFGRDDDLYVSSNATHEVLRYDGDTGAFKDIFVPAGRQLFPAFLTFIP